MSDPCFVFGAPPAAAELPVAGFEAAGAVAFGAGAAHSTSYSSHTCSVTATVV